MERNQCDGCQAGKPVDENGNHRMGDGEYADLMGCQRVRYQGETNVHDLDLETHRCKRCYQTCPVSETPCMVRETWYGTLTGDNIPAVVARLEKMLTGKRYVFIAVNEALTRHDVRFESLAPHKARSGKAITIYKDAGFDVVDTYGVWSLWTNATDRRSHDNYKNPYLRFEWNKVTIEHRAPAGNRLTWIIAVDDGGE